ncbi:MAG TPA: FGGY-family carbohydrate kinase [Acidimicrobiales bacterium]|nr:FGGY-family carbohydrate kinase [Acidimicrobiales bacterium]
MGETGNTGASDAPGETATDYVLGVDLGTGGAKVALVSTAGAVLGHEFAATTVDLLPDGGAEQDPDGWWQAIVGATRRLLDRADLPSERIVAACMSAQWGGTVAVDEHGTALHPALIWMDSRGGALSRRLTGGGIEVPGTGYNAARLARWLRRTGGVPTRTGKDPVGQIQWLRHERPEVFAAARWFLDVPEYLTMRLTGEAVAAYDTVVLRWCTDNRDPYDVRYDPGLVALCGLDAAKLPRLVPPATVVGRITPAAAHELGLGTHVQVVAGTGDTTAAAVGAGAVLDHQAHLYVGTSSWLSCHVPAKKTDLRTNVASLPSVVPGRYWVATVQDVAGKALTWLVDNVLYADDELASGDVVGTTGTAGTAGTAGAPGAPDDVLDRLNAVAAKVPPGSHGVVFTPWLNGERTPVDDQRLRGGWFNVSLATDRATLVRAVFEGVALNARWMQDAVEGFVRRARPNGFDGLTFVGGGASSALWCQIMADVLDRPIRQADDPVLANVRGAGLIGAVALGRLAWDDVPGTVAIRETFTPDPGVRATYDRLYRTFVDLHRRNKSLYARHNRFPWS